MRCKNCNGELRIEDEKCPYCSTVNKDAVLHRKNMKKYQKDYEETKSNLIKETKKIAEKVAPTKKRSTLNAILLSLCLITPYIAIIFSIITTNAASNKITVQEKNIFFDYIENEQYLDAGLYYQETKMETKKDNYKVGLTEIGTLCESYAKAYFSILEYADNRNQSSEYKTQFQINEEVANNIKLFYEEKEDIEYLARINNLDYIYKAEEISEKLDEQLMDLVFVIFDLEISKEDFKLKNTNGKVELIERSIINESWQEN